MLASAALAAVSLLLAAVIWGGFTVVSSLHSTAQSAVARTSPNGTMLGDGVNPIRAACDRDAVTLASSPVKLPGPVSATIQQRSTNTVVAGELQIRYSASCHSTWARFEPELTHDVPALRMLLWQIRASDSRRLPVPAPARALRAVYTGMLVTGHDCVIAEMIITLRTGPQSLTTTGCVAARARWDADTKLSTAHHPQLRPGRRRISPHTR